MVIIKDLSPYEETFTKILHYFSRIKQTVETYMEWVETIPPSAYVTPPMAKQYNETYQSLVDQANVMITLHREILDQLEETHPSVLNPIPREVSVNPYTRNRSRKKRAAPTVAQTIDPGIRDCVQNVHLLLNKVMTAKAKRLSDRSSHMRRRKRWLLSIFNTVSIWRGGKSISALKSKVNALIDQNELQEKQIQELAIGIKQTNVEVQTNRDC